MILNKQELTKVINTFLIKHPDNNQELLYKSVSKYFKRKVDLDLFKETLNAIRLGNATNDYVNLTSTSKNSKINDLKEFLINLKKPLNFRFAPAPHGAPTIGHFKIFFWNYYFSNNLKGRLILRFDDTNLKNSNLPVYYTLFKEMGLINNFSFYEYKASEANKDHFLFLKLAILKDIVYYCQCPKTIELKTKVCIDDNCKKSINLAELSYLLKKDGVFRFRDGDFAVFRKIHEEWTPTIAFQGPVDDYLVNIGVIIRGNDLESLEQRQKKVYKALFNRDYPICLYLGRTNLIDDLKILKTEKNKIMISKRHLGSEYNLTIPYFNAIFNKGVKPEYLQKLFFEGGFTKVNNNILLSRFTTKKAFKIIENLVEIENFNTEFIFINAANQSSKKVIKFMPENGCTYLINGEYYSFNKGVFYYSLYNHTKK